MMVTMTDDVNDNDVNNTDDDDYNDDDDNGNDGYDVDDEDDDDYDDIKRHEMPTTSNVQKRNKHCIASVYNESTMIMNDTK